MRLQSLRVTAHKIKVARVTDNDDLAAFCRSAWPRLAVALGRQFGDRALGEELAQEALIRVCSRWKQVSTMERPLAWAFVVGANLGRSRMRRLALERRSTRKNAHRDHNRHDEQHTVDRLDLDQALQQLPARQRQVLILRYVLDETTERTAAAMGMSSSAVRSLLHRATKKLAAQLPTTPQAKETHR